MYRYINDYLGTNFEESELLQRLFKPQFLEPYLSGYIEFAEIYNRLNLPIPVKYQSPMLDCLTEFIMQSKDVSMNRNIIFNSLRGSYSIEFALNPKSFVYERSDLIFYGYSESEPVSATMLTEIYEREMKFFKTPIDYLRSIVLSTECLELIDLSVSKGDAVKIPMVIEGETVVVYVKCTKGIYHLLLSLIASIKWTYNTLTEQDWEELRNALPSLFVESLEENELTIEDERNLQDAINTKLLAGTYQTVTIGDASVDNFNEAIATDVDLLRLAIGFKDLVSVSILATELDVLRKCFTDKFQFQASPPTQ